MRFTTVPAILLAIVFGIFHRSRHGANAVVPHDVLPNVNGIPVVRWAHLRNPYRTYEYGFTQDTTLATLMPGVQDPEPFYVQLWIQNNGSIAVFWQKLLEAKGSGTLQVEMDLLAASYALFACEQAFGSLSFCPSPCNRADICGEHMCIRLRIGLHVFDYKCKCNIDYSWDSDSRQCQYCGANSTWSMVWRTCVPIDTQDDQNSGPTTVYIDASVLDWADWGKWGECSNACGKGKSMRTRRCPLENDHDKCHGSRTEEVRCNGLSAQCLIDSIAYIGTAVTVLIIVAGIAFWFYYQRDDEKRPQPGTMFDKVMTDTPRERNAREYREKKREELKLLSASSRRPSAVPDRSSVGSAKKTARQSVASKKSKKSADEKITAKKSQKTKSQPPLTSGRNTHTKGYSDSDHCLHSSSVCLTDESNRRSHRKNPSRLPTKYGRQEYSYSKYGDSPDYSTSNYDNSAFEYNLSDEASRSTGTSYSPTVSTPSSEPTSYLQSDKPQYVHHYGSRRHGKMAHHTKPGEGTYGSLHETDTTL